MRTTPNPAQTARRAALAQTTHDSFVAARSADPGARATLLDQVITTHLWLADSLASRYQNRGQELDDLQQVARSGLVEAAHRFDATYGSFIAFAHPTIDGIIKRHFRDHGWLIRPTRRTQELVAQVRSQWPELTQDLRSVPRESEMAERVGQSRGAVREAAVAGQGYSATSLDAAVSAGVSVPSDGGLADLERIEAQIVIARIWSGLAPAEQQLLRLRYFEDRPQSDIAVCIGTSQMQVSRLLSRVLSRLRTELVEA